MNTDDLLLLKLQKCFDLKTNREVANFLGLSESMVSKILKGKKRLSFFYRLKILDKLGAVAVRDFAAEIAPERLGQKLIALSIANAHKRAGTVLPKESSPASLDIDNQEIFDDIDLKMLKNRETIPLNQYCSHLIKAFERLFKFESNDSLAEALGVDSSTISNIKNARQGIGEESCLKILYQIDRNFDINFIEHVTSSTDLMTEIIDSYYRSQNMA
jgi:transcriptional regulator with XRE-family HTH domain